HRRAQASLLDLAATLPDPARPGDDRRGPRTAPSGRPYVRGHVPARLSVLGRINRSANLLCTHATSHGRSSAWSGRDAGQCAFISPTGRRCSEGTFLEFHHVQPYARQGPATVANISLRSRRHNQYETELVFGPHRRRSSGQAPALGP